MSKIKKAFFCKNCGYESPKWSGKCPACNEWNSFTEEIIQKDSRASKPSWKENTNIEGKSIVLNEVNAEEKQRIISKDHELNRVLGGGIVPGSLVLVAGEPGIGKSTLFLQDALMMQDLRILYVSGEESEQQIKMRANRINVSHDAFYLLTETSTQSVFQEIKKSDRIL